MDWIIETDLAQKRRFERVIPSLSRLELILNRTLNPDNGNDPNDSLPVMELGYHAALDPSTV